MLKHKSTLPCREVLEFQEPIFIDSVLQIKDEIIKEGEQDCVKNRVLMSSSVKCISGSIKWIWGSVF